MFKDFISKDIGMQMYPIISLVIFVLFFTILSIKAFTHKKPYLNEMGNLPLDEKDNHEPLKESK